jgi:nitrite reductase (NADH) small subunit
VSAAWEEVCPVERIVADTGVCALVGGQQVAVFRLRDGSLFALGNVDPFTGAAVLSRGIVGDRGGVPKVASPLHKQSFDLRTGVCLDDPDRAVPVYAVRVRDGVVEVAVSGSAGRSPADGQAPAASTASAVSR